MSKTPSKAKSTSKPAAIKPSVFEFLDYRKFLQVWAQAARAQHSFSERSFAESCGFGSPSYLKMILDGKRNLSAKSVTGLKKGLKLSKDEEQFFEALVIFNQTAELEAKTQAYQKLLGFKKFQTIRKLEADSYEYYSRWENVALREALLTRRAAGGTEALSKSLGMSVREVDQSIALLLSLNLIEKNSRGAFTPTKTALKTDAEVRNLVVRSFHRQMIAKALTSLDTVAPEKRDMSALTIALSERNLQEVKTRIAQFRNELNALFSDDPEAAQVYQFNFQVFPLLTEEERK